MANTKMPWYGWVLIVVVGIAIFAPATFQGFVSSVTGGGGGGPVVTGGNIYATTPTIQLSVTNAVTGASVTDLNAILYRQPVGATALGLSTSQYLGTSATFNVSDKDQYQFVVINGATANAYYPFKTPVKTATGAPAQLDSQTVQKIGSVTDTIYNDDDVTANTGTAATAQSIAAGQTKKFRIRLVGNTNNAYFGDSKNILCADYNGTAYTSLDLSALAGQSIVSVGTPTGVTTQDTTHNLYIKCWTIDGTIKNFAESPVRLVVTASSGYDPGIADSNINIRVADQFLNKNTNTGVFEETFFDQVTGATLGATDLTATISVS